MRKRGQSGFALLLVFLMAAAIAITLYVQIPRVAFQAQRQKEQLLMERGEQYQRAIQLFVRANGRYPGEIKDLENFNNRRFLRHKFKDPITGKEEWRLIHVNAAGVFTDSLLNKAKPGDQKEAASTEGQYVDVPLTLDLRQAVFSFSEAPASISLFTVVIVCSSLSPCRSSDRPGRSTSSCFHKSSPCRRCCPSRRRTARWAHRAGRWTRHVPPVSVRRSPGATN